MLVFRKTVVERAKNHAEANKRWREKNREKFRAIARKNTKDWAECNPERLKEIRKREYKKNREKYLARTKAWVRANKEKVRTYHREYYKKSRMVALSPKCLNCESILKFEEITICNWCTKTYNVVS